MKIYLTVVNLLTVTTALAFLYIKYSRPDLALLLPPLVIFLGIFFYLSFAPQRSDYRSYLRDRPAMMEMERKQKRLGNIGFYMVIVGALAGSGAFFLEPVPHFGLSSSLIFLAVISVSVGVLLMLWRLTGWLHTYLTLVYRRPW